MIAYDDVRAALDGRLLAYQSENVASENTKYTPVEGVGYLQSFLLPAEPTQATVGASGIDRVSGIYQIDVAEPKDFGSGAVMRKVDAIIAQFARGLSVTSNGVTLTIQRSWPSPAITRDSFIVVPISVLWFTYG
jgi:hypothetical protein